MHQRQHPLPQLQGETFVTDGGIETHMIFNEGHDLPNSSVYLLNDSAAGRESLRKYYRHYIPIAIQAGKGFLFDTSTWRANADWGALVGDDAARLRAANVAAVELCVEMQREFAEAGVGSIISGVLGPRRDAWQYDGAMTVEEAAHYHGPQMDALAGTRIDFISAYTLTNTPEAIGIARNAERLGLPCVISFTLETDGNLPGGKSLGQAIAETDAATGSYPAYYMINCVHPVHFAPLLARRPAWAERIGGIRANASMKSHAELDASPVLDVGDWEDLAERYEHLLPMLPNLRVFGGCCGTDHRHIAAICQHCLSVAA